MRNYFYQLALPAYCVLIFFSDLIAIGDGALLTIVGILIHLFLFSNISEEISIQLRRELFIIMDGNGDEIIWHRSRYSISFLTTSSQPTSSSSSRPPQPRCIPSPFLHALLFSTKFYKLRDLVLAYL
mmetsp:Transcript_52592/g.61401  ORF Transcript_52592/g.61401 Transcript_52592/m.61401 type:complete len:127 (-) Transcript_52592:438-818(-)